MADRRRRKGSDRGQGHSSSRRQSGTIFKKSRKESRNKEIAEVTGIVQMMRDKNIFVKVDVGDDVFVRMDKACGALNGDKVRVSVTKEKTETRRREGIVREIIERSPRPFVGVLQIVGGQAWVLMQSRTMPYDIRIDVADQKGKIYVKRKGAYPQAGFLKQAGGKEYTVAGLFETVDGESREMGVHTGMKVAAVVDSWERGESEPAGHIVDVLGLPGENDTEMHAILAEYALPYRFAAEVENAADGISDKITAKDLKGRKDFRETLTFTIDP